MDPALIGFGLGVGILVGMTGIGGGSLMTPLLILLFGVSPITAVGTDLAYAAVTKTVGGYKHWLQKTVDFRLSAWMALGSVPAAVFGVYVLHLLEDAFGGEFDDVLLTLLAGALLLCGVATLARALMKRFHERERAEVPMERRHKIAAVCLGVFVGFVLGITSAGERRADRRGPDPDLPPHPDARGGHGRVPRRDPALGRGGRTPRVRERGLRARGDAAGRLGARGSGSGATGPSACLRTCCAGRCRWC